MKSSRPCMVRLQDASPYDPLRLWAVLMAEKSVLSEKRTGFSSHMSEKAGFIFPPLAVPTGVKAHVTECLGTENKPTWSSGLRHSGEGEGPGIHPDDQGSSPINPVERT